MKPGVSIIRDPALRKLRFLRFVDDKLSGLTHPQIAEKNGVSVNTVDREMSWGKRAGIIVEAEDHLLSTLFPLAKQAIIDALTPRTIFDEKGEVKEVIPGDVGVAMKLYDKVVKGREAKGEGNSLDELTKFIAARRQMA